VQAAEPESIAEQKENMTKILIVDDNPSVRAALRMCFSTKMDWIVCGEAENGYDAIELARSERPDIVLLDYAMPIMNGLEAARAMSAESPECALLLYTMFAAPELKELASAAGVRAVLSKEVNGIKAVMEAIESIASENADQLTLAEDRSPKRTATHR
jgi:DNA-binding NarL/FixJ family response regulator